MSEIDNFFKDLPDSDKRDANIFETPKDASEQDGVAPEEGDEKEGGSRKNRRERRMEARMARKDQMLEEMNQRIIDLSTKLKDTPQSSSISHDVPAEWIALYGDSPEARKAWDVNLIIVNRAKNEAKTEALEEFNSQQKAIIEEQQKFENLIDSELESLEDEHDVDLTSDAPAARKARREFLELIQELSPKDEAGTIIGYADFDRTFEIYQNSRKSQKDPTTDRRKELSSRSMTKGNSSSAPEQSEGPMTFESARRAINGMMKR